MAKTFVKLSPMQKYRMVQYLQENLEDIGQNKTTMSEFAEQFRNEMDIPEPVHTSTVLQAMRVLEISEWPGGKTEVQPRLSDELTQTINRTEAKIDAVLWILQSVYEIEDIPEQFDGILG